MEFTSCQPIDTRDNVSGLSSVATKQFGRIDASLTADYSTICTPSAVYNTLIRAVLEDTNSFSTYVFLNQALSETTTDLAFCLLDLENHRRGMSSLVSGCLTRNLSLSHTGIV